MLIQVVSYALIAESEATLVQYAQIPDVLALPLADRALPSLGCTCQLIRKVAWGLNQSLPSLLALQLLGS